MLPRTYGVVVSDVLPGSPAEAAGLRSETFWPASTGRQRQSAVGGISIVYLLRRETKSHLDVLREKTGWFSTSR